MATTWIWYVIVAVAAIGYACWRWQRYRARRSAIRKLAADRGWTYTEHEPALLSRCHGRPFGGFGERRRAWHAVTGRWHNLDVLSFEYSEVVGNLGRARRFWQQFTGVRLPFPRTSSSPSGATTSATSPAAWASSTPTAPTTPSTRTGTPPARSPRS
ncbi:hypothetical protein [Amycolatopsis sp. NPDC051903]|uniref:hypothetical protein n=1 Tax=Amycolatopsis sp. NPDC051903 TaxID=3363936 RepID=UPI0037ACF0C8